MHAFSHVTGGGLAANLARVLPADLSRRRRPGDLDPGAGLRPGRRGRRGSREPSWSATLNMGVGMVAVVPAESADAAVALLADRGVPAWVAGEVTTRGDARARCRARRRLRPLTTRERQRDPAGVVGHARPESTHDRWVAGSAALRRGTGLVVAQSSSSRSVRVLGVRVVVLVVVLDRLAFDG